MPRAPRADEAVGLYHALNRGNSRAAIFREEADLFDAFERILGEGLERYSGQLFCYPLMPNHWHFVLWPENDGDLSAFLQRLTNTHTRRWQRAKRKVGYGHLYQGRFKSFPVEADDHFYAGVRYVERNAWRANLVERAEEWRWGSLWRRVHRVESPLLATWPIDKPRNWTKHVNQLQSEAEVTAIRRCVHRSCPFGNDNWVQKTATALGLESTLRPRGRPKN